MFLENLPAFIASMLVAFLWLMGGHIITGFIEHKLKREMPMSNAVKVYIFWPFMPLFTQIKCLLGYA